MDRLETFVTEEAPGPLSRARRSTAVQEAPV
jgi:hypothetical protein